MERTKRRSICPVACALDIFGDKWTLLLIRDMAGGKTLFKEFSASPERIATNILADRLERLVASGLAESFQPLHGAGRGGYRLTSKGRSLLPVLSTIADWGLAHISGTEARLRPLPAVGRTTSPASSRTWPPSPRSERRRRRCGRPGR
jgi:DNA-binding HxlR family transcriptional regulator